MRMHDSNRVKFTGAIPHQSPRRALVPHPAALPPHHVDNPLTCNWSSHQARRTSWETVADPPNSVKLDSLERCDHPSQSAAAVNKAGAVVRSDKNQRRGTIWRKIEGCQ